MVEILREVRECGTIVKLQEVYRDKEAGTLTTVCELMAGSDLLGAMSAMKGTKIERSQCRRFIWQLSDALNFLHTRGIVHRDVRPENVLLTNKDPTNGKCKAKLNDFSTALYLEEGTPDGELVGAAGYMASP